MSHNDLPSDPELSLAILQRNSLARSLDLRACHRARTLRFARALRTLSHLGTALARRPAADDAGIPRILADAARRVRERAAGGDPPPWQKPDPRPPAELTPLA